MIACPRGHASTTDDICDVCGAPLDMGSAEPAPTMRSGPTDPTLLADPAKPAPTRHSGPTGTVRSPTGTMRSPTGTVRSPTGTVRSPAPTQAAEPPATAGPAKACPHCRADNVADALFCENCGYEFASRQSLPASGRDSGGVVPSSGTAEWAAEVWVDPDWFAHQRTGGTCPAAGPPSVVPLNGTVQLIGRLSESRNIRPEIDCSGDSAVSHRHAELSLSGGRWSVKDLGSTNGTYVATPGGDPERVLPPQQRRRLADDEHIYLGAWTRIVVRHIT